MRSRLGIDCPNTQMKMKWGTIFSAHWVTKRETNDTIPLSSTDLECKSKNLPEFSQDRSNVRIERVNMKVQANGAIPSWFNTVECRFNHLAYGLAINLADNRSVASET